MIRVLQTHALPLGYVALKYSISDSKGIWTPVTAVKGRCPGPLDEGDTKIAYHALRDIFV